MEDLTRISANQATPDRSDTLNNRLFALEAHLDTHLVVLPLPSELPGRYDTVSGAPIFYLPPRNIRRKAVGS